MSQNWLVNSGRNDSNFITGLLYNTWGIKYSNSNSRFIKNAKSDDRIWFIGKKNNGDKKKHSKIIAVATIVSITNNKTVPWVDKIDTCIEIYYKDIINLRDIELYVDLQSVRTPINIDEAIKKGKTYIKFNVEDEYNNIVKYLGLTTKFI